MLQTWANYIYVNYNYNYKQLQLGQLQLQLQNYQLQLQLLFVACKIDTEFVTQFFGLLPAGTSTLIAQN